jgi:5-(carboxyamino)imidazole ribonucleotide synthase
VKIGVLGGGQLAKMLALAGYPLGIELICIDPAKECPAQQVTKVVQADFHELNKINQAFTEVHCVTYETENLPYAAVQLIAEHHELIPDTKALKITQDRGLEKEFLNELNIPTAQYRTINNWEDLQSAIKELQFPLVLKTRQSGYDGKGQWLMTNEKEAHQAWGQKTSDALIVEAFVPYQCEVSLIFARSKTGEMAFYPLILNQHEQGILRVSQAPYEHPALQQLAEEYALLISKELNYVGVMAIEFFCVNHQLLVNELAPRVHNSGHWTIEGAVTSQFENHLRAIAGYPLGSTEPMGFSTMINCIGREPNLEKILSIPGLHYHTYGKSPRAKRKLGHFTICSKTRDELVAPVELCKKIIRG